MIVLSPQYKQPKPNTTLLENSVSLKSLAPIRWKASHPNIIGYFDDFLGNNVIF